MSLSNEDQLKLISKFNNAACSFPFRGTLAELFEKQAVLTPNDIALEYGVEKLSYSQLNARANQLAHFLMEQGSGYGVNVGVCADRSVELYVSILAILKTGAAYVPIDASYPKERIAYMIDQSEMNLILAHKNISDLFAGKHLVLIDDFQHNETDDGNPESNTLASDITPLAYILFTSGSTGKPKGVAMGNDALVNLLQWQREKTNLGEPSRTLQFSPISFDVSFQEIFSTWTTGGTLVVIDDELRLDNSRLLNFINENRIDRLFLPYIALQLLADRGTEENIKFSFLKNIITAGEQLKVTKQIRSFFNNHPNCFLHNHYGPTETHVVTSHVLSANIKDWPNLPPIGKPISNISIYILNDDMKPVDQGEEGEIYVAGAALAIGYYNQPALTNERFIKDPFDHNMSACMYRTGDKGLYLDDGSISYTGRSDSQVKVRGYRIEIGEIEIAISGFSGIVDCAVLLREDEPENKNLVAYYKLQDKEVLSSEIRDHLVQQLPDYMIPGAFVQVKEMPKTPSGKLDRKSLPIPTRSRPETLTVFVAPKGGMESDIARYWSEILRIDTIGATDNFFELGGNSLLAIRFVSKVNSELGIKMSIVDLYRDPTIKGLIKILNGKESGNDSMQRMADRFSDRDSISGELEDGIAIIGMAGKFPGANDVDELWEILKHGKETTRFFAPDELDPFISDSVRADSSYIPARGVLNDASSFDAGFFNINPKLARLMDPQQRVFLEVCWNALENAGYSSDRYQGLIGVYAGSGNNTYYKNNVLSHRDEIEKVGPFQVMTYNEKDYIATRVSHLLNLKGPAISVHTACSTSLVAVIMACESLWMKRCDMAIAGGVAITSPLNSGHIHQDGGMFSSDGHTRPFDDQASGTVFSDGAGAVILKRYKDAIKDGDDVMAVIRGTGINNDGSDKASFTAPSVEGQSSAVAMAYSQAGIDPSTISYIETHGTATPLGDPIEVQSLELVFGNSKEKQFCALGSIKSNFGHLTAAAGVAGLIKTVLMMKHKSMVPTVNYSSPNKNIDFNNSPFYVSDTLSNWNSDNSPLRAGISSFGVGGTNAHVVIENTSEKKNRESHRSKHLMVLSAKTEQSLDLLSMNLVDYFHKNPQSNFADICYTLLSGRSHFNWSRYIIADDLADAQKQLVAVSAGKSGKKELKEMPSGVVFMFPGQGSQFVNMGRALYADEPVFRDAANRCFELFDKYLDHDLKAIIFPSNDFEDEAEKFLGQTNYTQPALFTIGYSLAQLWLSWGVKPAALIGHSIGEFAAACISGVFSLGDSVKLVSARGKFMQEQPAGSMLSVRDSAKNIEPLLSNGLSIAAINGPNLCVVSGNDNEINVFKSELDKKDTPSKLLQTSHAFHSPMMDPVVDSFSSVLSEVTMNEPAIPIMSTSLARWLKSDEATSITYWADHIRMAVKFADGICSIWSDFPKHIMLELGPRQTASILARQQIKDLSTQVAIPSMSVDAGEDQERNAILNAVGQLFMAGIEINWRHLYPNEVRSKERLPGYVFEKTSFWISPLKELNGNLPILEGQYDNDGSPSNNDIENKHSAKSNISRKERIIAELKEVVLDTSGIDISSATSEMTFLELGLDSLFLTQTALTISKKYDTKVTFRQLNEQLSTLSALSTFIDGQLPEESKSDHSQLTVLQNSSENPSNSVVENLIHQQMKMLNQQLAALKTKASVSNSNQEELTVNKDSVEDSIGKRENEKAETAKPFGAIARIEKSGDNDLADLQIEWLRDFTNRYNQQTQGSKEYTASHRDHLADPRVVTGFKPAIKELIYQIVVNRSEGARLWDIDGNEYIDVLNGFGSNFLGYGSDVIKEAIKDQIDKGIEIGPQHELAGDVAKLICEFTGFDRAGFCNTGSEAVLGAMRIARTVTGRSLIVCFNGSYHGINDEVIVRGGRNLKSYPAAAGIPMESVENMLVLDYGTDESLEIIRSRANEIAAVLIEPIQSRRADFRPKAFLKEVRNITLESESLLIFDEVITGFRLMPGGAQEFYEIKADVGTYGKVIGGGMPIGVIAGKREYMDTLDGGGWKFGDDSVPESGVTYFAGTFVRHPLALSAAKAILTHMKDRGPELQKKLNGMNDRLVNSVNDACHLKGAPFKLVAFGSLFKLKWIEEFHYGDLLFVLMRSKGIHIYDGFPCFVTDAFTDADINKVITAFKESYEELIAAGFITTIQNAGVGERTNVDVSVPPVKGARLGKDNKGNPRWFIPDPERPGKYLQIESDN